MNIQNPLSTGSSRTTGKPCLKPKTIRARRATRKSFRIRTSTRSPIETEGLAPQCSISSSLSGEHWNVRRKFRTLPPEDAVKMSHFSRSGSLALAVCFGYYFVCVRPAFSQQSQPDPAGVVKKYCRLDFDGVRLDGESWKQVRPLIAWEDEPG